MKLYEADVGAMYWIAANNLRQAIDALWQCWETEGSLEDAESGGSLSIGEVPEERGRKLRIRDDGGGASRSMWDEMLRRTQPTVIACSEWP